VDFGLSRSYISRMPVRLAFVRPLSPSAAVSPPKGDDWLHEPNWDGFRFQVIKDGSKVRLYSHHGAEYTDRLSGMVEVFGQLPTQSAILDGELCMTDPRGAAHFPAGSASTRSGISCSRDRANPSRLNANGHSSRSARNLRACSNGCERQG
jgi:ATP-dependent DNA ligase